MNDDELEKEFDFQTCFTCRFSALEISDRRKQYICQKHNNKRIDSVRDLNRPTTCRDWLH